MCDAPDASGKHSLAQLCANNNNVSVCSTLWIKVIIAHNYSELYNEFIINILNDIRELIHSPMKYLVDNYLVIFF